MLGRAALVCLSATAFWSTFSVQAQTTSAVCRNGFSYLSNTKGQSPCLLAAYLEAPCATSPESINIPPLEDGSVYGAPLPNQTSYCTCSSVVYSLLSACGACQGKNWVKWNWWSKNCNDDFINVGKYPLDIPAGVSVPAWAYQNVLMGNEWDINAVNASTSVPESTYGTPTTTGTQTGTGTAAPQSTSAGSGGANAGAIVGGVMGGIGLLTLIAALAWLLIRRQRQEGFIHSPTGGMFDPNTAQMVVNPLPAAVVYGPSYTDPLVQSPHGRRSSISTVPPKLYDPSDPLTFPQTPASFGYQSTDGTPSNVHSASSGPTMNAHPVRYGQYSGAPEI